TLAIFRSRLWEIDILIRRTVTYTLVVGMLAMVYFGIVILLQRVFSLVIGALSVPLRNRIQSGIDKRFNRKRYDAQKVLEGFARTVRDETDLDKLTSELVNVVQETMQPKSVSVWLKKESRQE